MKEFKKNHYVSLAKLELDAYAAAAHFDIGRKAAVLILEKMGLSPGKYLIDGCRKLIKKILYFSTYASIDSSNKVRGKIQAFFISTSTISTASLI